MLKIREFYLRLWAEHVPGSEERANHSWTPGGPPTTWTFTWPLSSLSGGHRTQAQRPRGAGLPAPTPSGPRPSLGSAWLCLAGISSAALCRRFCWPLTGSRGTRSLGEERAEEGRGGEGRPPFLPSSCLQSSRRTQWDRAGQTHSILSPRKAKSVNTLIDSAAKCKLHQERAAGGLGPQD